MDNSKEFFDELYNSEFTQIEKYVRRMLYDSNAVEILCRKLSLKFTGKEKN